jgi:hypothetical protein
MTVLIAGRRNMRRDQHPRIGPQPRQRRVLEFTNVDIERGAAQLTAIERIRESLLVDDLASARLPASSSCGVPRRGSGRTTVPIPRRSRRLLRDGEGDRLHAATRSHPPKIVAAHRVISLAGLAVRFGLDYRQAAGYRLRVDHRLAHRAKRIPIRTGPRRSASTIG